MASESVIRLPYQFVGGRFSPVIQLRLFRNGAQVTEVAYVDSGAVCSIFKARVAKQLEISDYKLGRQVKVIGLDGRMVAVYLHRVGLEIGKLHFSAEVGFSDQLGIGFNLLGRHSVFNQLQFCFNDRDGELVVSPL